VLVSWKHLIVLKKLGGWGLKNIFLFYKVVAAKSVWGIIEGSNLWPQFIEEKYVPNDSIVEWIQKLNKNVQNGSIVWKAI
jgi:hypothetical protein